jgi:hypothetical protein
MCLPFQATQQSEVRRIVVPGQPGQRKKEKGRKEGRKNGRKKERKEKQNFLRTPSQRGKSWVWWHIPVILVTVGSLK